MNGVLVKQAEVSDIDHLVYLFDGYRQFYGKESNVVQVRDFLLSRFNYGDSVLFIAWLNGEPAGFTQLYPSFSSTSLARIFILNDLFVALGARKQAVATHLLAAAKVFAKTVGAIRLTLSTAITNEVAQQLYSSQGWKRDDEFYEYNLSLI